VAFDTSRQFVVRFRGLPQQNAIVDPFPKLGDLAEIVLDSTIEVLPFAIPQSGA
jgi:hypothetical protein